MFILWRFRGYGRSRCKNEWVCVFWCVPHVRFLFVIQIFWPTGRVANVVYDQSDLLQNRAPLCVWHDICMPAAVCIVGMDVTHFVAWLECVARSYVIRLHGMWRPWDRIVCFLRWVGDGGTVRRCFGILLFGISRVFACHDAHMAQACTHVATSPSIHTGLRFHTCIWMKCVKDVGMFLECMLFNLEETARRRVQHHVNKATHCTNGSFHQDIWICDHLLDLLGSTVREKQTEASNHDLRCELAARRPDKCLFSSCKSLLKSKIIGQTACTDWEFDGFEILQCVREQYSTYVLELCLQMTEHVGAIMLWMVPAHQCN